MCPIFERRSLVKGAGNVGQNDTLRTIPVIESSVVAANLRIATNADIRILSVALDHKSKHFYQPPRSVSTYTLSTCRDK
jgi:hypothetical protein